MSENAVPHAAINCLGPSRPAAGKVKGDRQRSEAVWVLPQRPSWRTSNSASSVVERKKDSKAFAAGASAFTPLFLVIRKPFRLIMPRYLNWPSSALSPMSRDTK